VFGILYVAYHRLERWLRKGDIIVAYVVLYSLGRFFVEFFRPDAWTIGSLATAQWIALSCMAAGIALVALRHIFWKRPQAPSSQAQ
jgi:phosphatidylglycerol:prolipoprotein diacylglycerol transferase